MRTISLVKRLKWSFSGNMNPHALVIGDVDNDGENEFAVGNLNGDLAIFKGHCGDGFPSYVCRGLGTITCIAIGDVQNTGKNSLVVINAEGHAHVFDIASNRRVNTDQHISVEDYLKGGRRSSDTASVQAFKRMMSTGPIPMNAEEHRPQPQQQSQQHDNVFNSPQIFDLERPNITLKVPVNVNKILIADIDNDHLNELILARTDRILHAFQLVSSDPQQPPPQQQQQSSHPLPGHELYKGIQAPSFASLSPSTSFLSLASMVQHQQKKMVKEDNSRKIQLLDKRMWVFDGQISSLCTTTHPNRPNEPLLLVAQPGNTFTIIDKDGQRYNKDMTPQKSRHTTHTTPTPFHPTDKTELQVKDLLSKQLPEQEHHAIQIVKDPSAEDSPLNRSNYIVRNWLAHDTNCNDDLMDGDDIESGAVATEIVMGKRHVSGESCATSEVGMLSMDGKFSIYDLKTMTISQRDLYVTHKLFSLATLNVSHASANQPTKPSAPTLQINQQKQFRYTQNTNGSGGTGTHTPMSNTSHLRFSSTPRKGSLNSRSSSKASFVGYIRNQVKAHYDSNKNSDDEQDKDALEHTGSDSDTSDTSEIEESSEGTEELDKESDSEYGWSEGESDTEDEPGCDLFVACAWNGVTYLIDWSKRIGEDEEDSDTDEERAVDQNNIKYQLVKFAFEGRVCAFTAGLYAVENHVNVPCLFYIDFEDQIYVYYDVHIAPGPVTGFIDTIDDDVEEALDRIMGIESGIESLLEQNDQAHNALHPHSNEKIDLGDGWEGIAEDEKKLKEEEEEEEEEEEDSQLELDQSDDANPLNLADFIHECLYGFHDMKERMENEMEKFEKSCLSNRLPLGGDVRRLSDLNITIEPLSLENESHSKPGSVAMDGMHHLAAAEDEEEDEDEELYSSKRHLSEDTSEGYNNDTHIASWIEGSLMNTSMFSSNKEHDTASLSSDSS
ncbi:hypothetical protein BD560DRAFT_380342 [Blakeslea trispora]|nr:hypothetical protein BD560DRAFT_380342 [Blakeslea trispora]